MICPSCKSKTRVLDNRLSNGRDNDNTYRSRQCKDCGHRFVTEERIVVTELVRSRSTALVGGYKRYFTGKLCKWGHMSERSTNSGACVLCSRERAYEDAAGLKRFHGLNKKIVDMVV